MALRRSRRRWLLALALLVVCAPLHTSAGLPHWLDWLTGGSKDASAAEPPAEPPDVPEPEVIQCTETGATVECIVEALGAGTDAYALHKLLRYPSAAQAAARRVKLLHVTVRGGTYSTIPLLIPDNTHLTIEKGSSLMFNWTESDLYTMWVTEALPTYGRGRDAGTYLRYRAHLDCDGCRNVVIDGGGSINGNGPVWWQLWRDAQSGDSEARKFLNKDRPPLIELRGCQGVAISDLTLFNTPWWVVHPYNCSNVALDRLQITNDADSPGTDGVVVDSSVNVTMSNMVISTGGDCVSLKSGWDQYGYTAHLPTSRATMRFVSCQTPHGAALSLGTELSGGLQNITADSWALNNTAYGVRLMTAWGRGGYVRDVVLRQWTVHAAVGPVLQIDTNFRNRPDGGSMPADPFLLTKVHNFTVADMNILDHSGAYIAITGGWPFWMDGFRLSLGMRRGVNCWRPVWVGGICEAAPGFLLFLWAVMALVAVLLTLALCALCGVCSYKYYKRRNYVKFHQDEVIQPNPSEDLGDIETIELINAGNFQQARQQSVHDSLQLPEQYVQQQHNGSLREQRQQLFSLPLKNRKQTQEEEEAGKDPMDDLPDPDV